MQEGHTVLDAIYKPSVIQTCENWKDIIIKEEANVAFSEAMAQKIPISIIGDPIKKSDKWIFIVELNPLDINTTAWLQTLSHVTVVTEQSMPQLMDFAIKLKNLEVTIEELDHIEEDRYEGIILTTPNSNNRCQIQLTIANPHLLNGTKLWVIDYSSFLYDLMKGNVDKALQIFDRIGLALLQEKLNPEEFTSNVATDKILEYPNFIFTLLDMLEKDHTLNNIPEYQIEHINDILNLVSGNLNSDNADNKLKQMIQQALDPKSTNENFSLIKQILGYFEKGYISRNRAINNLIELIYPSEQVILRNKISHWILKYISGSIPKTLTVQQINSNLKSSQKYLQGSTSKISELTEHFDFSNKIDDLLSKVGIGALSGEIAANRLVHELYPPPEENELTRYTQDRILITKLKELLLDILSGNTELKSINIPQAVVIQGPPGSGKTSYIAFLMELLFELYQPLYELALKIVPVD